MATASRRQGFFFVIRISKEKNMEKIIILLILVSCAQVDQKLDPAVYYKRDVHMIARDNGEGKGTMVIPLRGRYRFYFKFPGKADLLLLKTCHREIELEDNGYREKLFFYPMKGIEDTGFCPLEVAAFEAKRGRHSWGMIDFYDEKGPFQVKAKVYCNGETYNSPGVTICQSKQGLEQRVVFEEEVIPSKNSKCKPLAQGPVTDLVYKTPNRECVYIFKSVKSNKYHKLLTIGYEEVLVREL